LCDRCRDDRVSALMGMPRLPDVPGPVVMTDPDGLRHRMRYRVWRAPTGVAVELREEELDEGFEFGVFGDHDADVAGLVGAVTEHARSEIGRRYLALPDLECECSAVQ
jgi:hypothetical protein